MLPPPRDEQDIAWCMVATHREGGTWASLERTPEEAQASMDRQIKAFPSTYTSTTGPVRCGVGRTQWGLVWRAG